MGAFTPLIPICVDTRVLRFGEAGVREGTGRTARFRLSGFPPESNQTTSREALPMFPGLIGSVPLSAVMYRCLRYRRPPCFTSSSYSRPCSKKHGVVLTLSFMMPVETTHAFAAFSALSDYRIAQQHVRPALPTSRGLFSGTTIQVLNFLTALGNSSAMS